MRGAASAALERKLKRCHMCAQALELADKMEHADELPAPGQVDFIVGGPPCQGYSGMNRFNKGNWSMVQNSMVSAPGLQSCAGSSLDVLRRDTDHVACTRQHA